MHFGGPAVSRETGISGQPWAPGTWERTGHKAAFGLPVTGAHFPGRALGALSSGAVPRGSWGPQRLWEVIFIPGPQGRDSVMVVLGERKDRVTSQGASPSLPARCVPGRLQPARLVCLLALPLVRILTPVLSELCVQQGPQRAASPLGRADKAPLCWPWKATGSSRQRSGAKALWSTEPPGTHLWAGPLDPSPEGPSLE